MTKPGLTFTCPACGHSWTTAEMTGMSPGDAVTFVRDADERCPRCGAVDRMISSGDTFVAMEDGSVRKLASALRPPGATREDYQRLAGTLRTAANAGASAEEVANAVSEGAPFAALATWIKAHPDRSIAMLSLLATIVGIILANTRPTSDPTPDRSVVVEVHVHDEVPSEDTIHRLVEEELRRRAEQGDGHG